MVPIPLALIQFTTRFCDLMADSSVSADGISDPAEILAMLKDSVPWTPEKPNLTDVEQEALWCQWGFPMAAKSLQALRLATAKGDDAKSTKKLNTFADVLRMELEEKIFLMLPATEGDLLSQQEHWFGANVVCGFPASVTDMREAVTCMATERHMASVFHLLRAIERPLKAMLKVVGSPKTPEKLKTWGAVTKELEGFAYPSGHTVPNYKPSPEQIFSRHVIAQTKLMQRARDSAIMHVDEPDIDGPTAWELMQAGRGLLEEMQKHIDPNGYFKP
jgi:hypothetical protein